MRTRLFRIADFVMVRNDKVALADGDIFLYDYDQWVLVPTPYTCKTESISGNEDYMMVVTRDGELYRLWSGYFGTVLKANGHEDASKLWKRFPTGIRQDT